MLKFYEIKLYSQNWDFKDQINLKNVTDEISFWENINWWQGNLTIKVIWNQDDFMCSDIVEVREVSENNKIVTPTYTGIIEDIGIEEYKDWTVIVLNLYGVFTVLNDIIYKDWSSRTFIKNDTAGNITKNIIDNFNSQYWNLLWETQNIRRKIIDYSIKSNWVVSGGVTISNNSIVFNWTNSVLNMWQTIKFEATDSFKIWFELKSNPGNIANTGVLRYCNYNVNWFEIFYSNSNTLFARVVWVGLQVNLSTIPDNNFHYYEMEFINKPWTKILNCYRDWILQNSFSNSSFVFIPPSWLDLLIWYRTTYFNWEIRELSFYRNWILINKWTWKNFLWTPSAPTHIIDTWWSIDISWTNLHLEFEENNCLEALKKVVEDTDYKFYIDECGMCFLKKKEDFWHKYLTFDKELISINKKIKKNEMVNKLYLKRNDWHTEIYQNSPSISTFNLKEKFENRSEIHDITTQNTKWNQIISDFAFERLEISINMKAQVNNFLTPGMLVTTQNTQNQLFSQEITKINKNRDNWILYLWDYSNIGKSILDINK